MKKIFLILIVLLSAISIQATDDVNELMAALDAIKKETEYNSSFDSPSYYKSRLQTIHDKCQEADPRCCKAERVTTFGVSLFVGAGIIIGVLGTLAVKGDLHILDTMKTLIHKIPNLEKI